jgi:hypothetical protein
LPGYGLLLSDLLTDPCGPWEQAIGRLTVWPFGWADSMKADDTPATLYADGLLAVEVKPEREAGRRTGRLRAVAIFTANAADYSVIQEHMASWARTLTEEQREYPEVREAMGMARLAVPGEATLILLRSYYKARIKCQLEAKNRMAAHVRQMANG